jgi:hypothetical protein
MRYFMPLWAREPTRHHLSFRAMTDERYRLASITDIALWVVPDKKRVIFPELAPQLLTYLLAFF